MDYPPYAQKTVVPGTHHRDYSFILFPQPMAPYSSGEGLVRISTGGKIYTYNAPSKIGDSECFVSGKTTKLNIRFKNGEVIPPVPEPEPGDIDFKNKTHWVYGVSGVDYPRNDEASVPNVFPDLKELPQKGWFNLTLDSYKGWSYINWQPEDGWFDCDKDNPNLNKVRPGYKDGRMCWAASASNLLHWWMTQNRVYIEAYDKEYGTNPWPKYPRPSTAFYGERKSEIFDFFRNTCRDISSSSHFGVNWFITGVDGIPSQSQSVYDNFGGYFSRLFDKSCQLAISEKSLYKEKFNNLVKNAFKYRRGLGFTIADKLLGSHAMVIWGVEFDAEGYASAVYYVDNNDHFNFETEEGSSYDEKLLRHRLIRRPVVYKSSGVFMGTEDMNIQINSLEIVDLGREVWERKFGKLSE